MTHPPSPALRRICLSSADLIVGNSAHTLRTLLRGQARDPERHRVNYYGIDPVPFAGASPDRAAFRCALGLAPDTPILLFAGRMTPA